MTDAREVAETWVAAWNARDLEAVLALFAEDIVFTSPLARRLLPDSGGVVRGKAALRAYWTAGLAQAPQLHFTLNFVKQGIDVLVIGFRNEHGVERCEILKFREGLVVEGHGTDPVG